MEKFKELYAQYNFNFTDEDIKKEVEKILSENYDKYNTVETYKAADAAIAGKANELLND